MKRETLEKIRNILEYLFELFIFILIMLITFGSLHVHAAESSASNKKIVQDHFYKYEGDSLYFKYIVNDDRLDIHTEWEKTDFSSSSKYAILIYSRTDGDLYIKGLEYTGSDSVYGFVIPYGSTTYTPMLAYWYMTSDDSPKYWIYNNFVTNLPVLYMDKYDQAVLLDYL